MAGHDDSILKKNWETWEAREVIATAVVYFGADALVLADSFQIEDQAVLHLILSVAPGVRIVTLDTGRLPLETLEALEETEAAYGIRIERLAPEKTAVEKMIAEKGRDLFYASVENRKLCCYTRKVEPLQRALKGRRAWFTGLRREQAPTRREIKKLEWDEQFGLFKINPISDWKIDRLWDFIRENRVPYNRLYDQGYTSIGCAPCTRPATDPLDIRSGRWWWEDPDKKECGLHPLKPGKKEDVNG